MSFSAKKCRFSALDIVLPGVKVYNQWKLLRRQCNSKGDVRNGIKNEYKWEDSIYEKKIFNGFTRFDTNVRM